MAELGMAMAALRPAARSALAVVDVQERLFPAMAAAHQPTVVKAIRVLAALAREASWPVLVTEQYPKGLGRTLPELAEALGRSAAPIEKLTFSAARAPGVLERLGDAQAVVVTGIEAHVCVLETVLDLLEHGLRVFVPWDAVASRREEDRSTALALMRRAGATITSSETLVFQLLGEAGGPAFKRLAPLLK